MVLYINFILGHVPAKANMADEYLSQSQTNADTELDWKNASKLPTCEVDFNLALDSRENSLNVVHEPSQFHEMLWGESFSFNALEFANP